jgi:hypothetical protein
MEVNCIAESCFVPETTTTHFDHLNPTVDTFRTTIVDIFTERHIAMDGGAISNEQDAPNSPSFDQGADSFLIHGLRP